MFLLVWIFLAFLVGFAGSGKKIGYWGAFFLSLILSPVVGLIVGVVSDKEQPAHPSHMVRTESKFDQLERLKRLKDDGALTDAEFDFEKRRLLE